MKSGRTVIESFSDLGSPEIVVVGRNNNLSAIRGWAKHRHDAHEIIYLARGSQVMGASGKGYVVKGGDAFVVQPGEVHSTGIHPVGRILIYWIQIRRPKRKGILGLPEAESDVIFEALCDLPGPHFYVGTELKDAFETVIFLAKSDDDLAATRLRLALIQLLLLVVDGSRSTPERNLTEDVGAVVEHIRANVSEQFVTEDLADIAGLSASRFRIKFRCQLGMSPSEFILRRKVDRAIELMLDGDLTITDIAYRVGFSSSQYFATVFKRFTMQTPSQFLCGCR